MLQPFKLLIPALIPSWNFFDEIAASPRIEYALLKSPDEAVREWTEFRPRPQRVPFFAMLLRLMWNARWNESLFVVSCAERLLAEPTEHTLNEIFRRIAADIADSAVDEDRCGGAAWLKFRISLVGENNDTTVTEIAFLSDPRRLDAIPIQ